MVARVLPAFAAVAVVASSGAAQPVDVSFQAGLLTIRCDNAPLANVFEAIENEAGIELILEDEVKTKRLSADFEDVPVAMAVQRLLEGTGVNYAVMMDPESWGRVDKLFLGAGGGGGSGRPAPPPRRPAPRPAPADDYEEYDEYEDEMGDEFFDEAEEQFDEPLPGDNPYEDNYGDPNAPVPPGGYPPPGSSPAPSYLPPQQSFPRSRVTPGLPGDQPAPSQPPLQPQQDPGDPPPATFPFMDPLGRPIPVPENERRRQQR